jgi:hypothetical protein
VQYSWRYTRRILIGPKPYGKPGFHLSMHMEVSRKSIKRWKRLKRLKYKSTTVEPRFVESNVFSMIRWLKSHDRKHRKLHIKQHKSLLRHKPQVFPFRRLPSNTSVVAKLWTSTHLQVATGERNALPKRLPTEVHTTIKTRKQKQKSLLRSRGACADSSIDSMFI